MWSTTLLELTRSHVRDLNAIPHLCLGDVSTVQSRPKGWEETWQDMWSCQAVFEEILSRVRHLQNDLDLISIWFKTILGQQMPNERVLLASSTVASFHGISRGVQLNSCHDLQLHFDRYHLHPRTDDRQFLQYHWDSGDFHEFVADTPLALSWYKTEGGVTGCGKMAHWMSWDTRTSCPTALARTRSWHPKQRTLRPCLA